MARTEEGRGGPLASHTFTREDGWWALVGVACWIGVVLLVLWA